MAENDWLIALTAGLDENKSKEQLNNDIKAIQSKLNNVKVGAELDVKVKDSLLKQLNNLKIALLDVTISENAINKMVAQINNALSKINISEFNIDTGKTLQQANRVGQQIGNAVSQGIGKNSSILESFINSLKNDKMDTSLITTVSNEINKLEVQINSLKQSVDDKGVLSVGISGIDGFGQAVTLTRQFNVETGELLKSLDSVSTAQKRTSIDIEKTITDYTIKLENLKTKYSNVAVDYSGFNKVFDNFKNGTISVNELSVAFNRLENSVKAGTQNLKSQDKSLDPIQQAINNMRDFPATLQNIETGINSLKDKTSLADVSVKELSDTYEKLKAEMDSVGGKVPVSDEWTQSYRSLMSTVVELTNKVEALKKAEASDNSAVKLAEQVKTILEKTGDKGKTTTDIQLLRDNFTKLGLSADEVKNKMSEVDKEYAQLKIDIASGDNNAIVSQFNRVNVVLSQTQNDLRVTRSEYSQLVSSQQRLLKANVIEAWNQRNSKATSDVRTANEAYIASLRDLNTQMTKMQFNEIVDGFKRAENSMRGINRLGANIKNQFSQAFQTILQGMSVVNVVRTGMNYVRQMPSIVTELDTALVDLTKTADMSADELKDFYYASNDVAKQMGVTTNEILNQAAAWSRLGFNTAKQATQMAKYSAMFKMISPGMDIDTSTDGLVSIMKAFKIGLDDVNEVVDGIMSKVNIIGNTRAVNNTDIITFLTRSSSAMAEANNTLEDTIALGTAMTEITRDAAGAGQVLKTVSMRIRGYDENTEEFIGNVEELSGKIADLTKTASTPGGISLFSDAAKTEFKSTREILGEISEIYEQLSDKNQAQLLEVLAGKRNGQAVAAILSNYNAVEDSLNSMANSAGNAEAEMSVAMDSIAYKANKLSETGTGIAQNLFNRDDMKTALDFFNSLAEILKVVTDKLGLFGTIGLGAGLFAGFKNVGSPKMFGLKIVLNIPTVC